MFSSRRQTKILAKRYQRNVNGSLTTWQTTFQQMTNQFTIILKDF